jgi:hypothetical protein
MHPYAYLLLLSLAPRDSQAAAQKSWTLFHSTTSPADPSKSAYDVDQGFRKRGRVHLSVEGMREVRLTLENDPGTTQGFSTDGWYKLLLVPDDDNQASTSSQVSHVDGVETTVPACQVRRANFRYVARCCIGTLFQALGARLDSSLCSLLSGSLVP